MVKEIRKWENGNAIEAATTNSNTRLMALAKDKSPVVRLEVAKRGKCLDILKADKDYMVRVEVAKHIPEQLRNDPNATVRKAVVKAGYVDDELLHDSSNVVRAEIAKQGKHLDYLAKDNSAIVRVAVAEQGVESLKDDPVDTVRGALAKQGLFIDKYINDPEWYVRKAACTNHMTHEQMMLAATDSEYFVRAKAVKVCYENQDKYGDILDLLRKDESWYVKYAFQEMEVPNEEDRRFETTQYADGVCEAIIKMACSDLKSSGRLTFKAFRIYKNSMLRDAYAQRKHLFSFFHPENAAIYSSDGFNPFALYDTDPNYILEQIDKTVFETEIMDATLLLNKHIIKFVEQGKKDKKYNPAITNLQSVINLCIYGWADEDLIKKYTDNAFRALYDDIKSKVKKKTWDEDKEHVLVNELAKIKKSLYFQYKYRSKLPMFPKEKDISEAYVLADTMFGK